MTGPIPFTCNVCGESSCEHFIVGGNRRRYRPLKDRFWSKVEKTAGCWIWRGATQTSGHGRFGVLQENGKNKLMLVHRYSWELANGPIPPGLCVCHNCPGGDNASCINPSHLFLGTLADNNRDSQQKGTRPHGATHSARIKQFVTRGDIHHKTKVTDHQVRIIRTMRKAGWTSDRLGVLFGIGKAHVGALAAGRARTSVGGLA